jgi:hypothetical protein
VWDVAKTMVCIGSKVLDMAFVLLSLKLQPIVEYLVSRNWPLTTQGVGAEFELQTVLIIISDMGKQ